MTTTKTSFLERLERSCLLSPQQLAALRNDGDQSAEGLARGLIRKQWITRWQARQLLSGETEFSVGKYQLLDKLGQGGMGAVYKARQTDIDRLVAIKSMSDDVLDRDDAVQRFLRESRAMAAVSHPHIVTAYDVEVVDGNYYLVMEYVEGRDLESWSAAAGQLPVDWACECILQAALGLEHAHRRGLIHRDIKPSNLLVIGDSVQSVPHVKLLDMGIARFCERRKDGTPITATGEVLGTPDYMAPDQALDPREIDIRADIYSLGCTLFKLLTGEVPLVRDTPLQTMMARNTQDPPPPSSLRADLPPMLDEVVMRMMAREPSARYATPAEVAAALAPFAMQSSHGSPTTVAPRPAPASGPSTDPDLDQFVNTLGDDGMAAGLPDIDPPSGDAKRPLLAFAAGLVLLLLIGAALGVVIKFSTPDGSTVLVKVSEPEANIEIDGGKIRVTSPKLRVPVEIEVPAGKHELRVTKGGFETFTEKFEISGGDGEPLVLTAKLVPRAAAGPRTTPPVTSPPAAEKFPLVGPDPDAQQARQREAATSYDLPLQVKHEPRGLEFVLIPPGKQVIGTPTEVIDRMATGSSHWDVRYRSEGPQREVTIERPYYLAVHETTVGDMLAFLEATGYKPDHVKPDDEDQTGRSIWAKRDPREPVAFVSWNDGRAYCKWLSEQDGQVYRLPTEVEWENAARAGTTTQRYFGDDDSEMAEYAWYDRNARGSRQRVGQKLANPFGVYDILGNVWEWCLDPFDPKVEIGVVAFDLHSPPIEVSHATRGGAFNSGPEFVRSSCRTGYGPDYTNVHFGFRVLREIPRDAKPK